MSKEFQEAEVYLKTLPKEMSREEIAEAARKLHDIFFPDAKLFSPPPVVGDLREQLAEWFFDDYSKVELGGSCGWGDYKDLPEDDKNAWRNKADSILSIIKEAGLVKLNKDQIQLSDTDEVIIDKVGLDPFAVRGMVKAGWRKIA